MGQPQAKKGTPGKNKSIYRRHRTSNYGRDNDQIFEDLQKPEKFQNPVQNEELPGLGQFYCITCALHFVNQKSKEEHLSSKRHKRRNKILKEEPFNQKQARLLNK